MDTEAILRQLSLACRELRSVFGEEFRGMILFGSLARGEARDDSDVDVFIVFRSLRGLDVRAETYKVLSRLVKKPLTLVATTEDVLRSGRLTSLTLNIGYEGIVVCDEDGSLREFKNSVLSFIKRAGLVRYRTTDGKYGWRREDDKPVVIALQRPESCSTR